MDSLNVDLATCMLVVYGWTGTSWEAVSVGWMEDETNDILLRTNIHIFWRGLQMTFGHDTESHSAPADADLNHPVGTYCVSHARTEEMTESSRVSLWASCEDLL